MKKILVISAAVSAMLMSQTFADSGASKVYLARAEQMLKAANVLVHKAQKVAGNPTQVTFHYGWLSNDINQTRAGIRDYLNQRRIVPTEIKALHKAYGAH